MTNRKNVVVFIIILCGIAIAIFIGRTIVQLLYLSNALTIRHVPLISNDGRYVFFVTQYGRRVIGENDSFGGLYRYDNKLGVLQKERLGIATHDSTILAISHDGEQVLLGIDLPLAKDVLYNCSTHTYRTLTSEQSQRLNILNGQWIIESMQKSRDGRFEVMIGSRLGVQGPIVVVDHKNNSRVCFAKGRDPIISADGSTVAFLSADQQVLLYFLPKKQLICASKSTRGLSNKPCLPKLTLSPNGRYLLFISQATNLTKIDTPFAHDIYLFDRDSRKIRCVSSMRKQ